MGRVSTLLLTTDGKSFNSDVSGFLDQPQELTLEYFYYTPAATKFQEFCKMKTELLSIKLTHKT